MAHHAGEHDKNDIVESMKKTLSMVNATLDDIVQLNFFIKNIDDFRKGVDVFREYFKNGDPARMTVVIDFVGKNCLCQMNEIVYKPKTEK